MEQRKKSKLDESVVYDAAIVAVMHSEVLKSDYKINDCLTLDTKTCLDRSLVDARL